MSDIETVNQLTDEELEQIHPVVISVIGPTNEGKTSILRTLSGDPDFGEISARTGSTTRTEYIRILYKNRVEILRLADTPGFQMSGAIADRFDLKGPRSVASILAAIPAGDEDFRHDRRAWTEVAQSDIIIYAANTAESPQHSLSADSLFLLGQVEKPIIVLFNAISTQAPSNQSPESPSDYKQEWIDTLQKNGLHLFQSFDAYRRKFADEYLLFEKICSLIHDPFSRRGIRAEIADRIRQEKYRIAQSRWLIAEMMLDLAEKTFTAENVLESDWKSKGKELQGKLADFIAMREHQTHRALLDLWRFNPGILEKHLLRTEQDCSEKDHRFGKNWRKHSGSGAAIGALIGLGVDVMSAGLSLGTGTTIGALIGGLFGGTFNAFYDKKDKKLTVRIPIKNCQPLLARSIELAKKLQERGQAVANTIAVILSKEPKKIAADEFFSQLKQMTSESSGLQKIQDQIQQIKKRFQKEEIIPSDRKDKIDHLAELLEKLLPDP